MAESEFDDSRFEHLFTLTNTDRHSTGGQVLERKQVVRFAGQGPVEGIVESDLVSETTLPKRLYKIKADILEVEPSCRHCGKPI